MALALRRAARMRYAALVVLAFSACVVPGEDDGTLADEVALQPFHGRFGSPSIVRDGDTLHAYFPIQSYNGDTVHVAHARSDDDGATWLRVGDALPKLNRLAKQDGAVWAP